MISDTDFIGNGKAVRYLNRVLQKGSVSHAYLFEGPEHVGKMTLALRFASELLETEYAKVRQDPDLIFTGLLEDEREIAVDAIRELQKCMSLYPFRARYKVAIIESAERMSPAAQNALLKTLEEPGKTSVLLLLSSDSDELLSTIRSRCQSLTLGTTSAPLIEAFLSERGKPARLAQILAAADGKPGTALALAQDEQLLNSALEERGRAVALLDADNFQRMEAAGRLSDLEREEAADVLDLWVGGLRQELIGDLHRAEAGPRTARLEGAITKTLDAKRAIAGGSVNLKLALENLCLGF